MRSYPIELTLSGDNLTASPSVLQMGSMYDNLMHRLVFARPPQLAGWEMLLQFRSSVLPYAPINRGTYSDYVVPNTLMLAPRLDLQVSFRQGNNLLHADWIRFDIRHSAQALGVALEPLPLPAGPPGEAGPAGKDGLTTSVNGVAQVNGNISLTAGQIPYASTTAGAALDRLDALVNAFMGLTFTGSSLTATLPKNWIASVRLAGATTQEGSPLPAAPAEVRGVPAEILVNGVPWALEAPPLHGPLAGQEDAADVWRTDTGEVLRHWGVRELRADDPWNAYQNTDGTYRFGVTVTGWATPASVMQAANLVCSHFPNLPVNSVANSRTGIGLSNSGILHMYHPQHNTTLEDFKAWLAGEQVVVRYRRAQPATEAHPPLALPNETGPVTVGAAGEMELTTRSVL